MSLTAMQKAEKLRQKTILMNDGSIKPFSQIVISAKVAVILTNIQVDMNKFFELVPITHYEKIEKKRGRKRNGVPEPEQVQLPVGSCIFVQKGKETRGTPIKKISKKHFLHCVTSIFALPNKRFAYVKIPANGKLHLTGCQTDEQYLMTLEIIINKFQEIEKMTGERVFALSNAYQSTVPATLQPSQTNILRAVFNTVMINRDFIVGFRVSRENLDRFVNENTEWKCYFEGAMFTSAQIKINNDDYKKIQIPEIEYNIESKTVISNKMRNYEEFQQFLEDKNKKKEKRNKYFTFAVFENGSVIMSGRGPNMEQVYNMVVSTLIENRQYIEQVIEDPETERMPEYLQHDLMNQFSDNDEEEHQPKRKRAKKVTKKQVKQEDIETDSDFVNELDDE